MQAENRGVKWETLDSGRAGGPWLHARTYVGILGASSLEQMASFRTFWSPDLHISSPSGGRFACLFTYVCIKPDLTIFISGILISVIAVLSQLAVPMPLLPLLEGRWGRDHTQLQTSQ